MKSICAGIWLLFSSGGIWAEPILLASSDYTPHTGEHLPEGGALTAIVQAAFDLMGQEVEIHYMPFARAMQASRLGQYAGVIGVKYTPERELDFYFPEPVYDTSIVFFKRIDEQYQFDTYLDLVHQGVRYGSVLGYSHPEGLLETRIRHYQVASEEQLFRLLSAGRVDLMAGDKLNGVYLLLHDFPEYSAQIDWLEPPIETQALYLLFSRQHPQAAELNHDFSNAITQLKHSGELDRIKERLLPSLQQLQQGEPKVPPAQSF
ncbi:transporter substrate-binding domain-containing protein [Alkalimonas sp. MEB108]|uniref:Transporter substrate-binding domain-containing protein n=1 Tax=Alkalimonas cellulosilytica TaxID=3058395 RepID=A0ABU7J5R4_9GAMM|nr:transporter substrate-binding domain-containing protein [Alkalimonas sp. MEB108]MEE2001855.1 transporter substrate-binding domain-containing protein [Alkalimonas sp. MEB108]